MPTPNTIIGRYPTTQQFDDFLQLIDRSGANVLGGIDGHGFRYGTLAAGDIVGVETKTANYTATASDNGFLLSFNSASPSTLTLPATAPTSPWVVWIQNIGAGTLTVNPNSLQLDASTNSLTLPTGSGLVVFSNGSAYFTERGTGGSGTGFNGVSAKTTDYTALPGDTGKLLTFTKSTAVTLTLPATSPGTTWFTYVQNTGAGILTIARNGLTIDGGTTNVTLLQNQGCLVFSDGTNYFTDRGVGNAGNVNAQTTNYTLVQSDSGKLVTFSNAGAITATLPAAAPAAGWWVMIENTGVGALTVSRNGLNIDGAAANLSLVTNQGVVVYSDGANYFTQRGSATATNAAIKPNADLGIQYISADGNDTNDGLSMGTAKKTIMAGYDALPASGGTVIIIGQGVDTTKWPACTTVSGQGIWIMGVNDPNYASPPSGWRKAKNGVLGQVSFVGIRSSDYSGNTLMAGTAGFLSNNDGTAPAIWLSGVSQISFINLSTQYPQSLAWIGVDSNRNKSDLAGGSNVIFENCGVNVNPAGGPGVDIGPNMFWVRLTNCAIQANLTAPESSDARCAILMKEGTSPTASITATSLTGNVATYTAANVFSASQIVTISGCTNNVVFNGTFTILATTRTSFTVSITHADITSAPETATAVPARFNSAMAVIYIENTHFTGGGGIRYYNQHEGTNTHTIRSAEMEGTGETQPLYEVMSEKGTFSSNIYLGEAIADSGNSPPVIRVHSNIPPYRVTVYHNTIVGNVAVDGPATLIAPYGATECDYTSVGGQAIGRCSSVAKFQSGLAQGRLLSSTNAGRRLGIGQPRWLNRVHQLPSLWSAHGTASITTGVTAPDLTTNAATITAGVGEDYATIGSMTRNFLPGDYVLAGVWAKAASAAGVAGGDNSGFNVAGSGDPSPDFRMVAGSQNSFTAGSTNGNFSNFLFHQTDGDWQWLWSLVKCRVAQSSYNVAMILFGYNDGTTSFPMSYYAPVLMHIPLADLTNQAALTIAAAGTPGVTQTGNIVTVTTTTPHKLYPGQIIVIAGVAVDGYNGECAVATVPSSTTFTYYDTTTGLANSGSGTVSVSADSEAAEWALCYSPTADDLTPGPMMATLRGVPVAYGGTGDNFHAILDHTALTANRTILAPDAGGTMALTGAANSWSALQSFADLKSGASGVTITQIALYTPTLTPASVAANTSAEQLFTVSGVSSTDVILACNGPTPTAGTVIANVRVSNTNQIAITFGNVTAGGLTPVSGTYALVILSHT